MAISHDNIIGFILSISENHSDAFKMAPYYADLNAGGKDFSDDKDYHALLDVMLDQDKQVGFSESFQLKYAAAMEEGGFEKCYQLIEADMRDNYVMAGLALKTMGINAPSLPLVAMAAFNKSKYPGIKGGEFALVRILHWAGFDIDGQDPDTGYTALHYFASMNVPPYTNLRALGFLLEHEADPSITSARGDTPLIYLGASVKWNEELTRSFLLLANHQKADLFAEADDGSTARSLMEQNDPQAPNEQRQALIAEMVRMEMDAEVGAGRPAPRRQLSI